MATKDTETALIRPAPVARTWALEVQDGTETRVVPLSERALVLGSGRAADVRLDDRTVSGRHVEARVGPRGVLIHDLGSTNGTFVGGALLREATAGEGTTIVIGQTTIVCAAMDDDDEGDVRVEPLPGIAGGSKVMRKVAAQVRRFARGSAPVLVSGETGTGKELVARALHTEGGRAEGPFIAMNVASLPRELVESELFGHERGAFTGAVNRRAGAFVEAEDGTLFLDEIGELPLDAQPKLLRALDGYEVRRIGSAGSGKKANARVVVATHVNLPERVVRGTFRRDLFHRLEVYVIELPPLRERPGDILPIARHFFETQAAELGRRSLTSAALAQLTAHDWQGNIRELRHVLIRACDFAGPAEWIEASAIDRALRKPRTKTKAVVELPPDIAREVLVAHGGNVSAAARAMGVARTSFRKLLANGEPLPSQGPGPAKVR